MKLMKWSGFLALAVIVGLMPASSHATVIFTGTGLNPETGNVNTVSAASSFTITGNTLTLTLSNTTLGGTLRRGDVLQGVAFDISGPNPSLSLSNVMLTDATDRIFTSKTASNTSNPLGGSYTNVLGSSPIAEFGVSSSGFSGAFAAGNLNRGNGGTDYGIVADGTFPAPPGSGTNNSFNNSAFPLIQNSLTFTLNGIAGISESQIQNVKFLFGTDGTGVVSARGVVPEPASLTLLGLGGAFLGANALRRRRALSAQDA